MRSQIFLLVGGFFQVVYGVNFVDPPPMGPNQDFLSDLVLTTGSQHEIQWLLTASTEQLLPMSLVLYQEIPHAQFENIYRSLSYHLLF